MPLLKKIVLGNQAFPSEEKNDKFLLTGYFLLMYILVDVLFLCIHFIRTGLFNIPVATGLVISIACLALNRKGWRNAAILTQLLRTNFIAFLFSYFDVSGSGSYLFYVVSGIGAMALFGYEERWKGILFSTFSLLLFYVSVTKSIANIRDNSGQFYVTLNFTVTYLMGLFIIYFLNQLTYFSRKKEQEKHDQLSKVNAELDRFVYSVSHDLRAPLSSISGLIQLVERSDNKKETLDYLNLMKGRIDKLEQFIRDIINFSRNARSELRNEPVNIRAVVSEIFETLKFINGAESIAMKNELPDDLIIVTDKARLQIVLFNLISNSIQYRDSFKESFVMLSCHQKENHLEINLDDNGIGIDSAHQEKVFNMFYRATDHSKGSGLGLYIVRETLEKLGGRIALQSIHGEGTRFTIELPIRASTSEI